MPATPHLTRALSPDSADYPARLFALLDEKLPGKTRWSEPPVLHVRGAMPAEPLVAIVGTREPCEGSLRWTRSLVRCLGEAGFAVGSGGARGIDACAHRAALDLGVPTLVVTVGGLDVRGPSRVEGLFEEVLRQGGGVASLDPDGTPLERREFFPRNHVLAALACGLVAVEVRPKPGQGGTGHTVRAASAMGRRVWTLPHAPWSPGGPGCIALHRLGVRLVASPDEVLDALRDAAPALPPRRRDGSRRRKPVGERAGAAPDHDLTSINQDTDLDDAGRAVLAALGPEPSHLDAICATTGLGVSAAFGALLACCMAGLAIEEPPGRYARRGGERVASGARAGEGSLGPSGPAMAPADEEHERWSE
ncbi:MAG: DNA-processing protein DprA [Deltaproteobacteria bacterium]|nr:DNA-processing protein DprA [Deltaproteobacteria bacterium]